MKAKVIYLFLAVFTIAVNMYSGVSYGHAGTHNHHDSHTLADAYLAEQARARESKVSYLFDQWQQELGKQLTTLSGSLLAELVNSAIAATGNPALEGQWSAVTTWPFVFASAANLPDGRILAWGGNNPTSFNGGTYTYAATWDPVTGNFSNVNHSSHSMFCGIPVMLEDGRVFVSGGDTANLSSVKGTSTFNFKTNTWTRIQDLAVGRWYNGSVALPNGKVFSAVGQPGSEYPELWSSITGWSYLNNASLKTAILDFPTVTEPRNWLPHLHLAPNGKIFHSGHTPNMHFISPEGNGAVTSVSISNDWNTANTASVLWDEGKILQAGGALYDAGNTSSGNAAIIDLNSSIPSRTPVSGMQYPRIFHNQVVLPNGEVMVIGGNSSGLKFNDTGTQYIPEIWSPLTKTWRSVATQQVPRNYHSVALLMTDGRVWSGGGGLCNCAADHPDSQIFSPPYLYNSDGSLATRPEITNAPSLVSYGRTINVTASPGISKFTLIKMSSTTHALNSDMRLLNVPFFSAVSGEYDLTLHTNPNVMTPGYWMLFAIGNDGVPSVAKVIQVSTPGVPILEHIGDQSSLVGSDTHLVVTANDPNGDPLTYNAIGLPQGLSIDTTTGVVSGLPISTGVAHVVVSVNDGTSTTSIGFNWQILNTDSLPISSPLWGASTGTAFTDNVTAGQIMTGLNVRSGWWIDAIQGLTNTESLAQHGGNGGAMVTVTWPADEYLVRLYGVYGAHIGSISFVTNTGRVLGPFGSALGGNDTYSFDLNVPVGREIVGFTGRADTYLDAIGVLYRVHIVSNQPPVVTTIADQANTKDDVVNLAITANDPDNDTLTYSAVGLPTGLAINASTGVISGIPTLKGSFDTIVTITDARGATSALNFIWKIIAKPYVIESIMTKPRPVNSVVTLAASVTGAVNPLFKWSFGDGSTETNYSTAASVTHVYKQPGLYVVRLTVIDDSGTIKTTTFIQAIHLRLTAKRPNMSSNMAIKQGTTRLWVVNQDNNSVSLFNTGTRAKRAEIAVGKAPRSVAVAPNGKVWVTNKADATVSIIDPVTLKVQQVLNLPTGSEPFGLVFSPDGTSAYVVLEAQGKLLKLNPSTGGQIASLDVGTNPRHLSVSSDSSKILVSRFITRPLPGENTATVQTVESQANRGGEVIVVDANTMTITNMVVLAHSDKQDIEIQGAGIPNYLAMPVISPDGQSVWVPSKQDNIKRGVLRNSNNLNFQNTVRAISSKINLTSLSENYNARIDFDNSGIASAATFNLSGNYLFVALESTRAVSVVDAYGGRELARIDVGRAPDGLIVSPDGNTLYVNNFMDRTVSVIDLKNMMSRGEWLAPVVAQLSSVAHEKLVPDVLTGKQLFYDAKDTRLARDGYLSCSVCHNDGGHDGRVWDLTGFGEGLRNTINLQGRAGMSHGRLHWTANFDEIQDFEGQIRNLAGGTGLMGDMDFIATQETLDTPKAGKSTDLDALAAYVTSLSSFGTSPFRNTDGTLTAAAVAGKALYTSAGCIQCHNGAPFTDSPSNLVHDIGTIKPSSGMRLNAPLTGFDSPTLRDAWKTAPYLHDGSALTLDQAILAHTSVTLTSAEISQIAAYVQQIGGTEPAN